MFTFKPLLTILIFLQLLNQQVNCASSDDCPDGKPAVKPCKSDNDCRIYNLVCADTGNNQQFCCSTRAATQGCKDTLPDECQKKTQLCKRKEYKRLMIKFCNSVCFKCKTPP
ncbi:hypothetical protein M3Y97_01001800 [Aphelenchoides bicaudatus]|nr:hypothetical protein M3Y97_01001800 [Aphelenchoides bicaudatus]